MLTKGTHCDIYTITMKLFDWDDQKNRELREERGISFEEIIFCISQPGGLLDIVEHPNSTRYKEQKVFIVSVRGYVYAVPFVESKERIFLKTIYPSRKLTKKYIGKDAPDEKSSD